MTAVADAPRLANDPLKGHLRVPARKEPRTVEKRRTTDGGEAKDCGLQRSAKNCGQRRSVENSKLLCYETLVSYERFTGLREAKLVPSSGPHFINIILLYISFVFPPNPFLLGNLLTYVRILPKRP